MAVPRLLSPLSLPSPSPPLLRNGTSWRCPKLLRAALRLPPPPPLHLGLAAARGDGGRRFVGTLGSKRERAAGAVRISAISGDGGGGGAGGTGIAAAAAATVVFAVMNRVLYKLALVPMKNYPFFLAQFATFGFLSVLILGRKYRANQILGCLLVTIGVILAVAGGAIDGPILSEVDFFWPAVMMTSAAFQAAASIIKEFVFIDGAKRLEGKRPDIFVVNSFGSGFQALFIFLLLPFLSNLKGIPFAQLPAYLNRGAACFLNVGGNLKDCHGAPLLPLLYMTLNIAFNISVLNLVKMSTAVVASLTSTLAVPLSIYILSLPLPYLPEGTNLSTSFLIGVATLVFGLLIYNLPQKSANQVKKD